ncbi:type IV pilus modification protein PilV [Ketobacter alkanivorans]|uniref:Type IV pilus modification protein PilV n=2 Tax=Ketobacter alkanivorans TaxID=1917421 RepID=A0A2K9LI92_9GAMM|nr:type IV pilus modification protein PilV [Ketobacter alkanivorans]
MLSGDSMQYRNASRLLSNQSGVTLIEVLVALLVFGVGVVGFAALQLKSVIKVEETYSRSQAMSIAQDLIERAGANNTIEALEHYLRATSWSAALNDPGSCVITAAVPGAGDGCSSLLMAQYDVFQVRSNLTNLLTNGKIGIVRCEEIYCVTVAWADTQLDDCDESAFEGGQRQSNAHCVQIPFHLQEQI